ncbi:MAG: histone deacetylase [Planctomycetota bacterium]
MQVGYCDHFEVALPAGHRFPMHKYALLRERLLAEGVLEPAQLVAARPAAVDDILTVHDADYVLGFLNGTLDRRAVQRLGFPWSEAMVLRSLASVGSTLIALESALARGPNVAGPSGAGFGASGLGASGLGATLAGGTHHAYAGVGSGYCVFNDLAIAARLALATERAQRVLIFDVDVHQGDGTAALFADEPRVFTCSLHGARNFPARKQQSDLDIPLPDGTRDEEYLAALDRALDEALERSRPDLVLVQAGVDVLEADRLGRLALTHAGVRERDRRILRCLHQGAGLPVVLTLGGGYSDPIDASVEAYVNTYREAQASARSRRAAPPA